MTILVNLLKTKLKLTSPKLILTSENTTHTGDLHLHTCEEPLHTCEIPPLHTGEITTQAENKSATAAVPGEVLEQTPTDLAPKSVFQDSTLLRTTGTPRAAFNDYSPTKPLNTPSTPTTPVVEANFFPLVMSTIMQGFNNTIDCILKQQQDSQQQQQENFINFQQIMMDKFHQQLQEQQKLSQKLFPGPTVIYEEISNPYNGNTNNKNKNKTKTKAKEQKGQKVCATLIEHAAQLQKECENHLDINDKKHTQPPQQQPPQQQQKQVPQNQHVQQQQHTLKQPQGPQTPLQKSPPQQQSTNQCPEQPKHQKTSEPTSSSSTATTAHQMIERPQRNRKPRKIDAMLLGSSIIKHVRGASVKHQSGKYLKVACFPGADTEKVCDHAEVEIKYAVPEIAILHAGGNDLANGESIGNIVDNLAYLGLELKNSGSKTIAISGMVPRTDLKNEIPELNRELKKMCQIYGYDYINNNNIFYNWHLSDDLVHLNFKGVKVLQSNYISYLKNVSYHRDIKVVNEG